MSAVEQARCVACGREASEFNSLPDADGVCRLIAFEKFTVCFSCIPTCSETVMVNHAMEPEEAALRCWYSGIKNASIPFEEAAEMLMARDEVLVAKAVAERDAAWREGAEAEMVGHDAGTCSALFSAEPNHPFCDCGATAHNAALAALAARMEAK